MSETPKEPWMMTASGHAFPILHPKEEDFILSDIAHHLSQENRFNGAARFPYSVAQHSLYCYYQARQLDLPFNLQCEALFHDAHEAYCKDLTNPTKLG